MLLKYLINTGNIFRMVKRTRTTLIPSAVKEKIDLLPLNKIQKGKAYKLIKLILKEATLRGNTTATYKALPQKYLRKVFNDGRYDRWLSILVNENIIEPKTSVNADGEVIETYQQGITGKSYRICQNLLTNNWTSTVFEEKQDDTNGSELKIAGQTFKKSIVRNDLGQLFIHKEKMFAATEHYIASLNSSTFKVNEQITAHYLPKVINHITGFEGGSTITKALHIAQELNASLIQDDNVFYIDDLEKFIAWKKHNIRLVYGYVIETLTHKYFYANRNATNNRLDHNLTSVSSLLLDIIKVDNNLVEIDLANSQFSILAHLMSKDSTLRQTEDFELFRNITAQGKLYGYIQEHLKIATRDDAKRMMMELSFSSPCFWSPKKKALSTLFPNVVTYIERFKKDAVAQSGKGAHNEFAIKLQKMESEIFIDNIYFQLKNQGLWCVTRHDSLLVKCRDLEVVKRYLEAYFKSIEFVCSIRIK